MSRPNARPRVDHQHAADQARQMPGQWVLAGTYGSSASAQSAALQVRTGEKAPAYRPAGAFEGRTLVTQDGADLWVRYTRSDSRLPSDFAASIASGLTEDFDAFSRRLDEATTNTTRRTG
ncbi:hypothetical protein [Streptomyces sp. 3214.6]|uniref:hypothetical protein n=1 Tax=Streptomyces sp. 3214.6 TaxID=1882757 RepID=UPI00090AD912|nr:hypothetical protein [Streptomyces sp. 3214.6]SHI65729.1 hypothetical protein SAMN05444521_8156 [Streptomyces sp. 3214.6]